MTLTVIDANFRDTKAAKDIQINRKNIRLKYFNKKLSDKLGSANNASNCFCKNSISVSSIHWYINIGMTGRNHFSTLYKNSETKSNVHDSVR